MRVRSNRWFGAPLIFLVAGLAQGAAQAPPRAEPPVFGVGVSLVAVPVFVTDKSGRAVAGLTADDFEIEDGGKKVPIAAFQAIDADVPSTLESQEKLATLPVAVQAAAARQFLLLIDMRFSPRAGLFFARKAATEYVRNSLASGDLVAVATTGPSGLKILTNFTSDHNYVAEVIAGTSTAGTPSSDPLGFSSAGRSGGVGSLISDPLGTGGGLNAASGAGGVAEAELAEQDALAQQASLREYRGGAFSFLGDLEKLVQAISPLRGRKQIVLFSGGFSETSWTGPDGEPLLAKMGKLYREAGRADVVIHSVDLAGIQESIDLASQTGPNGNLDATGPSQAGTFTLNQDSGRGTLVAMSLNTGGRAIRPRGDFGKAFGEVDQISRHSYVIAFEATESEGKSASPRSLKVRVKGAGLSVSYRPEYTLSAPRVASQIQATEAIAKGLSGGRLGLHLTALPYRDAAGARSVHAVLRIDGGALAEAATGKQLAVQVFGYAMASGRVLDGIALNTGVDVSKFGPALKSSGITLITAFPVSTGNVDLRFFVRAGTSDLTGSLQRTVAVPAFGADQGVLSSPIFLLPPAGQVVFPFQPQSRRQIKIPFYAGDERFVPDTTAILTPGRAREACVFVWRDRTGPLSPFNVSADLIRPGQPAQPIRLEGAPRVVPDSDGFDRYMLKLIPPDTAGDYTLRLTFADPGTGRTSRTETAITIER